MSKPKVLGLVVTLTLVVTATTASLRAADRADFQRPLDVPFPESAPFDPGVATLGKMLFFDPRLSGGQNMSCASCHSPSFGWEAPVPGAIGSNNEPLPRHANTTLNLAWTERFFWDGRAGSLEEQARGPITAEDEMNATMDEVVDRLSDVPEYAQWFDRLFPNEGLTEDTILQAIATFERTIVSGWAPFDRWVDGDDDAISVSAQRGFELFVGDAHCSICHVGWNFTDNDFHDIGLYTEDRGLGALTGDAKDSFAFKTPGLRNIAQRAPFMHHGELPDLESVIWHYVSGGIARQSRSPSIQPLDLTDQDVADLVAFMETLTEEEIDVVAPLLPAN